MKKTLFVLVALLAFAAVPVSAQTYLTTTTTSVAITSTTQDTFTLTSATDVEVGGALYIDHEVMNVVAVSGTRVTVTRNQAPTTHVTSSRVIIAKRAQKAATFVAHETASRFVGSCTAASQNFLPKIDVVTGDVFLCRDVSTSNAGAQWTRTNVQGLNGAGSLLYNLQ